LETENENVKEVYNKKTRRVEREDLIMGREDLGLIGHIEAFYKDQKR